VGKEKRWLLGVAVAIVALMCIPQEASATFVINWYFGCNAGGMIGGGAWNPTRWLDSDGLTPMPTTHAVQFIWDQSCDGVSAPVRPTCDPSDPDDIYLTVGAAQDDINTMDIYHDALTYDGIGDGVAAFVGDKTGRWAAGDTLSATMDYPVMSGECVCVRVFDGPTCATSLYYGDKCFTVPTDLDDGGTGIWTWNLPVNGTDVAPDPSPGTSDQPIDADTPTPTVGATDTPTPTPTPTDTPVPTDTPTPTPTSTPTATPVATPEMVSVDLPNKEKDAVPRDARVEVTFNTLNGVSYTVQYTDDYDAPVWTDLAGSTVVGTGAPMTVTDTTITTELERYYRVREETTGGVSVVDHGVVALDVCDVGRAAIYGMPLVPYSTDVNDVIGWQMSGGISPTSGDYFSTWNNATRAYESAFQVDTAGAFPAYDGLWYASDGSGVSSDTISWGEGFWLKAKIATETVWFEGQVPDTAFTLTVPGAAGDELLVGQPYPVDSVLNTDPIGYAASGGTSGATLNAADNIILWNCNDTQYRTMWLSPGDIWWDDGLGVPSTEALNPGEGFWLKRGTNAAGIVNWTYPKPY